MELTTTRETTSSERSNNAVLCLDSGGNITTELDVRRVPLPIPGVGKVSSTYEPVANGDFIDLVKKTAKLELGLELERETWALSAKDQRMFATLTYNTGNPEHGLNIALRNSYDTGCSAGIAIGNKIFVCDNLCMSGDFATFLRRHTLNVWPDLTRNVTRAMCHATAAYDSMTNTLNRFKEIPVKKERGYEIIGLAMGKNVLAKQQVSVALEEWKNPSHEEFSDRNAYSLYNAFTEALKKGTPDQRIVRQTRTHHLFTAIM